MTDPASQYIEQAIREIAGTTPPTLTRSIIRGLTERLLDKHLPFTPPAHRGGFLAFLKDQTESSLWTTEGDEDHDKEYYRTNAAGTFLPIAAREMVNDGLDPGDIAQFCVEAALEALEHKNPSQHAKEKALLGIVLRLCVTIETSGQAAH